MANVVEIETPIEETEWLTKAQIRAALIVAMIDGVDKGTVVQIADILGLRPSCWVTI